MKRTLLVALLLSPWSVLAQPISTGREQWVRPLPSARVSLTSNGPWLDKRAGTGLLFRVKDSSGARIRFVESFDDMQLLLYVESAGLATCTLADAVLYPSEAAAAKYFTALSPGFKPDPGTEVIDATPGKAGLVKLTLRWRALEFHGYIPGKALGKMFAMNEVSRSFTPDVSLPGNYRLLDAPGGNAFVFSTEHPELDRVVAQTLGHQGKYLLVRVVQGAVGWIASSAARPLTESYSMSGDDNGVEGGGMEETALDKRTLPIGTVLYDAIDGQSVGNVTGAFTRTPSQHEAGWSRFDVRTEFGIISVWARAALAKPASATPAP